MNVTSLWIGDKLHDIQKLCIKSFLDHGHDFTLYTYKTYDDVPEGTIVKDANTILPEEKIYRDITQFSYAPFSDWWRYKWLYENGGFWVDMDIVCVSDKLPDTPPYAVLDDEGHVCIGALQFEKGDKLIEELVALGENPCNLASWDLANDDFKVIKYKQEVAKLFPDIDERRKNCWFGYIGPLTMTKAYNYYGYKPAPPIDMFPIPQKYWNAIYSGELHLKDMILTNSWGIHLWGEYFRCRYYEPNKDSLLYELMKEHGVTPEPGRDLSHASGGFKYYWEGKSGTLYIYMDGTFVSDDPEFSGTWAVNMDKNQAIWTIKDKEPVVLHFVNAPKDYTLTDRNGHTIFAARPYLMQ